MNKKYRTEKEGDLYRIYALRDFGDVKAGDKGGLVQCMHNLSHEGDCWIYDEARVYGYDKVFGTAQVCGDAKVYEGTHNNGLKPKIATVIEKEVATPKELTTSKESTMSNVTTKAKNTLKSTYAMIKPYEKPIILVAVLVSIDYFIFKGGLSGRIKGLAGKLVTKIEALLDNVISKIGE